MPFMRACIALSEGRLRQVRANMAHSVFTGSSAYADGPTQRIVDMVTRRRVMALCAAQIIAPSVGAARAQTPRSGFPHKPVRVIVPVAAGGPTDLVARML